MKKSKEGSTLIFVVTIAMFTSIVLFAFLSMVTSNYYGRVSESKKIQNLYASESGLDITYNIICKDVEAASVNGKYEIEQLQKDIQNMSYSDFDNLNNNENNKNKKMMYALYEDINYWKSYNGNLKEGKEPKSDDFINSKIKTDEKDIENLKNIIFREKFKEFVNNNLNDSILNSKYIQVKKKDDSIEMQNQEIERGNSVILLVDNGVEYITYDEEKKLSRSLKVESGYDSDGYIQYYDYSFDQPYYEKENYNITVLSEFKTDSASETNTKKVGENLRKIQTEYCIRVPNYDEVAFKESVSETDSELLEIPGITVGGSMKIYKSNALNVIGDVFVQGKESNDINLNNRTYEKYFGGIEVNNDKSIQNSIIFNNNVFSRETFNIKNNSNVQIKGDLYAKNIYAGDVDKQSSDSNLSIEKDVVIDNDLSVKATQTNININNFYGINYKDVEDDNKVRKSSSIIINDYKTNDKVDSSVKVNNIAYIMGVAHINTENGYQTGESVAVKGNYKAYSVLLEKNDKFIYDNPLQLLDENNIFKKAKHFYDYWSQNQDNLDCGGVILPGEGKTKSVGAIVCADKNIVMPNMTIEDAWDNDEISEKRMNYARNIYTLGLNKDLTEEDINELYDSMGSGEKVEDVSDLLSNLSIDYNLADKDNDGKKFTIFCSDNSKDIIIKGKNASNSYNDGNNIIINAVDNKDVKGVIVTKGRLFLDGEVNFRGDIISEDDLSILGNGNANLYYDKNITKEIQKNNSDIFREVFGDKYGNEELEKSSIDIRSNSSDFLETKLWKIIQ